MTTTHVLEILLIIAGIVGIFGWMNAHALRIQKQALRASLDEVQSESTTIRAELAESQALTAVLEAKPKGIGVDSTIALK
ncbi:hypothetical protein CCGE525_02560 [Rhizobium jaguaris]|uniref:Uncharacterized protein n=1 Tax=Rhizobium jaguaris TaxID=1312183 RepID=A0A387FHI4_9HYPH|nr:hypothetical protein CCGE525_02560 [Rhizobium jaguaris]